MAKLRFLFHKPSGQYGQASSELLVARPSGRLAARRFVFDHGIHNFVIWKLYLKSFK